MRPQAHIIMGKHACADLADGVTPVVAQEEKPMPPHSPSQERSWLRSPGGLILLAFLAIAAFFLILEHRAHVFISCRMCCSSCVPCCICSCTAGMAAHTRTTTRAGRSAPKEVHDAY